MSFLRRYTCFLEPSSKAVCSAPGLSKLQLVETLSLTLTHVQVKLVKEGKPYVMFGDGTLASCKPISEADLAAFMADCVAEPDKVNQVLPIGGGPPLLSMHRRCDGGALLGCPGRASAL